MTRDANIVTQEKAAQHLNAGEIDELGIMEQIGAAPASADGGKPGLFDKVADALRP